MVRRTLEIGPGEFPQEEADVLLEPEPFSPEEASEEVLSQLGTREEAEEAGLSRFFPTRLERLRQVQIQGTAERMPFPPQSFERVIGRQVLGSRKSNIEFEAGEAEVEEVIPEVLRVLRPGGTAQISFGLVEALEPEAFLTLQDRREVKSLIIQLGGERPTFSRTDDGTLVLKFLKRR